MCPIWNETEKEKELEEKANLTDEMGVGGKETAKDLDFEKRQTDMMIHFPLFKQ